MKSYYLHRDGKTITSEHPGVRVKSVARATNKKAAIQVFNTRFEKVDGVYTDRKPGATPRRRTILALEAKPKVLAQAPGSKICLDPDCDCSRAGDPESEVHMPLPPSVSRAVGPESKLGTVAESLDDTDPLLAELQARENVRVLFTPRTIRQQVFYYRDVTYTVPEGSKVTLTAKGEILLQAPEQAPEPEMENAIDLMFQGKP